MGDSIKRRLETDDEEDFVGFDDSDANESQDSFVKRMRREREEEEEETMASDPNNSYSAQQLLQTEEEYIALYQNWEQADKTKFPSPGQLGLPFEYGWKRELVFRGTPGVSKEKGDVYYITPQGRKLRTRNEITVNLTPGLSMDNFSLSKVPLYLGPEYEIVRSAKLKSMASKLATSPREITPQLGKRIPKPKAPKGASPPPTTTPRGSLTPTSKIAKVSSPKTPLTAVNKNIMTPASGNNNKRAFLLQSAVQTKPIKITPKTIKKTPMQTAAMNGKAVKVTPTIRIVGNRAPQMAGSVQTPSNLFRTAAMGYDVLMNVFQCLTVKELLRASRVCRLFNYTANHPSLWRTVRMKNSAVTDWEGFAKTLRANGTRHLDMRKMLIPASQGETVWKQFVKHIGTVEQLQRIDLCGRCPPSVVEALFSSNRQLRVINGPMIRDTGIALTDVKYLTQLVDLRLRPETWSELHGDLKPLVMLSSLRHLSLTFFNDLNDKVKHIGVLENLTELESLELGECTHLITELTEIVLPKLKKLRRLRLERGPTDKDLLTVVAKMPALDQLELINFDVRPDFHETLGRCSNIRKLMVIPTYIAQSATTNNQILRGVLKLAKTLKTFTWVVTQELLRVTELYQDQQEGENRPSELIPIGKPVPGRTDGCGIKLEDEACPGVDMVPLVEVEEILQNHLPETFVTILKEHLSSTWRLNIVDS